MIADLRDPLSRTEVLPARAGLRCTRLMCESRARLVVGGVLLCKADAADELTWNMRILELIRRQHEVNS